MSKYLPPESIQELIKIRDVIFAEQQKAWKLYGVDLLSTDGLSSLQVYEIVKQYDADFNVNFARNGEDGVSNGVLIESKTTKIKKTSSKALFMFHAMGDIFHDRYIFVVRNYENLSPIRLFDIAEQENVEKVKAELLRLRENYLSKGFRKYDGIHIKEKFILKNLKFEKPMIFSDCIVNKDVIY